jgi:predicted house-cleaning NTP pyrophosphatase (Maf/HAM1 superfamily)
MSGQPFPAGFELFLASQSPRRRELLASIGVPFRVVPSEARETLVGTNVGAVAEGNALAKARAAVLPQGVGEGSFVLGVDTVVRRGRVRLDSFIEFLGDDPLVMQLSVPSVV